MVIGMGNIMLVSDEELINKIVELLKVERIATTYYIMRKCNIGINRLYRLIPMMIEKGLIKEYKLYGCSDTYWQLCDEKSSRNNKSKNKGVNKGVNR